MVYGESWYLNIVAPGWDALVDGDYKAVMPLIYRSKWGIQYIFQPPFTQQLGVFGEKQANSFLAAIPNKFKLADIQLNSYNECSHKVAVRKPNLILDLNHSLEEIRGGYSENTRRNIRKATIGGFQNNPPASVEEIISLFRKHRGQTIDSLSDKDYHCLSTICAVATQRGQLEIEILRSPSGDLFAGAIFLRSTHGWIFLFSATHTEARNTGVMHALIDRFIEKHAGERTLLDFEGSSNPNLYRFYKSFGSQEIVYLQLRINRLPFPFNLFKS